MTEDSEETWVAINAAVDSALTPLRAAVSKPARRAYLSTILFAITNLILLGAAVAAYSLFYLNYIPQIGLERVVHLQFSADGPIYGTAPLSSALVSLQSYDVSISVHLPRTPSNLGTGNFMLDLSLSSPPSGNSLSVSTEVLARSERPAILTYTSPMVDTANRLAQLPWYLLGWRHEAEILEVKMMEGISFQRGWKNVPGSLRLEIRSKERMQFYSAKVRFIARFSGLRWIMYNHRIISLLVFTTIFWSVEVTFTSVAWLVLSSYLKSTTPKSDSIKADGDSETSTIKKEEESDVAFTEGLSDTTRSFPTYSRQPPLRYNPPRVKTEDEDEQEEIERTTAIEPLIGEADDEEDDDILDLGASRDRRSDSGLGTSMDDSAARREGVQRRRTRLFGGRGGGGHQR
ncbi:MAG: hypothetical protein M1812_000489 [Candelaria pacifica]|nr:MAG: hypothetical protein M1812_000489 [Candelaria pacifica]